MVENGRKGAIVSISSIFGKVGGMHKTAYSAAKAGLDGLTRVMALELGAKGIRVNSCHPTAIPTEMGKTGWEDEKKADWLLSRTPLGKFGEVDHVIDSIVFLLNTDSVNGVNLMIDGGFTCAPFCLAETKVSNMSEP
jgi:L-xylulose reductase